MIEAKNISKKYQDKYVLSDVSISLPKGRLISLIGANGAGKSTLLSIISRLLSGEGTVKIDGKLLSHYEAEELSRKLAVLCQSTQLNIRLTVRELISFGRYPHTKTKLRAKDQQIIQEAICYMGLEGFTERYIDELSGGERQRALIAMIIAQDTEYILLDEPLNNLDLKHSVAIMKLLRQLVADYHKSVILVIHDLNFASCYSDYIVALKEGRLLYEGETDEIITKEKLQEVFDMQFDIREIEGKKICLYYT